VKQEHTAKTNESILVGVLKSFTCISRGCFISWKVLHNGQFGRHFR